MGQPRRYNDARKVDKVRQSDREQNAINYDHRYLDGAAFGFKVGREQGYREGYTDCSEGKPPSVSPKPATPAARPAPTGSSGTGRRS